MALSVWSVDLETAVAYALVAHSTSTALHLGLGSISALALGVDIAGLASRRSDAEASRPRVDGGALSAAERKAGQH
jgi:hypothetical protein